MASQFDVVPSKQEAIETVATIIIDMTVAMLNRRGMLRCVNLAAHISPGSV